MTKAQSLIPGSLDNNGFDTKDAATAILARTYLIQGNFVGTNVSGTDHVANQGSGIQIFSAASNNFAGARDAANAVIQSGNHALADTYDQVFDEESGGFDGESIFNLIVTDQDGVNNLNTYFAPPAYAGRGDIVVQSKHTALYDATDTRGKFTIIASNRLYSRKHLNQFGDVNIVRLAEMYLIRAEANFRLNTSVGASPLVDINTLRSRAGAASLTQANLSLDKILLERKLELAFEGLLLQDVKRLKLAIGGLNPSDPKLILPIPQREIDTNKSLVQNSGY